MVCKTYSCLTEYDEEETMNSIRNESYNTGKQDGIEQGIKGLVEAVKEFTNSKEATINSLMKSYQLTEEVAKEKVELYWIE